MLSFRDLDKSNNFYFRFIDDFPFALFRTTPDGRLVFGNRAFARILGFNDSDSLMRMPVIEFYQDEKDREALMNMLIRERVVEGVSIYLKRRDGGLIHRIFTISGGFDSANRLIHVDGVMREAEDPDLPPEAVNAVMDIVVLLDRQGKLLRINTACAHLLGFSREELIGKSIFDFIVPLYRELFSIFLTIVHKTGREEGVLTILDRAGVERDLEFLALLVPPTNGLPSIKVMARDVTSRIIAHRKKLNQEKFSGILEMAGGVSHKLNQPLTIIGNMVQEVLTHLDPHDLNYQRMRKIRDQVMKLHEIAKKIGNIRKYEAIDYVAGVRIVDIDRAS